MSHAGGFLMSSFAYTLSLLRRSKTAIVLADPGIINMKWLVICANLPMALIALAFDRGGFVLKSTHSNTTNRHSRDHSKGFGACHGLVKWLGFIALFADITTSWVAWVPSNFNKQWLTQNSNRWTVSGVFALAGVALVDSSAFLSRLGSHRAASVYPATT